MRVRRDFHEVQIRLVGEPDGLVYRNLADLRSVRADEPDELGVDFVVDARAVVLLWGLVPEPVLKYDRTLLKNL
jgi:hypothetical protein